MFVPLPQSKFPLKGLFLLGIITFGIFLDGYTSVHAGLLPIPAQSVVPGETFVYKVELTGNDSPAPIIRMINAPLGASLDDNQDGSRTFRWRAPVNMSKETVVLIQATDPRNSRVLSTQRLILRPSEPDVKSNPSAGSVVVFNSAPTLPEIAKQSLIVSRDYQLYIRPDVAEGRATELNAQSLPNGASLDDAFGASRVLHWRPSADQVGEHTIVFRVSDAQDPTLSTERSIVFEVSMQDESLSTDTLESSEVQPEPQSELQADIETDSPVESELAASDDQPFFDPISSQVVSAGKRVNFLVRPRMPDQSSAILHVDRLPPTASFADNHDGTRTFDWLTTEADQGEHVFRFTAIHHQNVNQRVTTEVLIIVGDPAAPGSQPDEVTGDLGSLNLTPIEQPTQGS